MRPRSEKQNGAVCSTAEDTFGDAFTVTAMSFEEKAVKTNFYKIFGHLVEEQIVGRCICDIFRQGESSVVCTDEIMDRNSKKLAT